MYYFPIQSSSNLPECIPEEDNTLPGGVADRGTSTNGQLTLPRLSGAAEPSLLAMHAESTIFCVAYNSASRHATAMALRDGRVQSNSSSANSRSSPFAQQQVPGSRTSPRPPLYKLKLPAGKPCVSIPILNRPHRQPLAHSAPHHHLRDGNIRMMMAPEAVSGGKPQQIKEKKERARKGTASCSSSTASERPNRVPSGNATIINRYAQAPEAPHKPPTDRHRHSRICAAPSGCSCDWVPDDQHKFRPVCRLLEALR